MRLAHRSVIAFSLLVFAGAPLHAAGDRDQPAAAAAGGTQTHHSFQTLDYDDSGTISKIEALAKLPGLAAGFDIADQNNDGKLSRPELDEAMALSANMYGEGERSAHKREIFRSLDIDGDRAISKAEARWRPQIAANFTAADRNADGKLGVSEFGLISVYALAVRGGSPQGQSVDVQRLYRDGLSANEVIGTPVRGENGERIGEVKDIVVDEHARIARLIVEVGGFFELGDQHIGVPWKNVKVGENMAFIQLPLREVQNGTYSLAGVVPQGEDVPIALTSWRVNELIGDYAALKDSPRAALVTDVIFDSRGQLQAVLVDRLGRGGLFAYPFAGYSPGAYAHLAETVIALEPFDYRELGRRSLYAGAGESAAAGGQRR
ncbi:MAG TPA: PRC-barrel domain-containing protein [Burkholderiales bacterium]|nr:PRC-barrel domain-containing protein [Burkholderiales bacterium]